MKKSRQRRKQNKHCFSKSQLHKQVEMTCGLSDDDPSGLHCCSVCWGESLCMWTRSQVCRKETPPPLTDRSVSTTTLLSMHQSHVNQNHWVCFPNSDLSLGHSVCSVTSLVPALPFVLCFCWQENRRLQAQARCVVVIMLSLVLGILFPAYYALCCQDAGFDKPAGADHTCSSLLVEPTHVFSSLQNGQKYLPRVCLANNDDLLYPGLTSSFYSLETSPHWCCIAHYRAECHLFQRLVAWRWENRLVSVVYCIKPYWAHLESVLRD